jgi:hypothetical protein
MSRIETELQTMYEHVATFHLEELSLLGISQEEISLFKKGFQWEPTQHHFDNV